MVGDPSSNSMSGYKKIVTFLFQIRLNTRIRAAAGEMLFADGKQRKNIARSMFTYHIYQNEEDFS